MTKPIAHILNDLHIGRPNAKIDYHDEFERFIEWFLKNVEDNPLPEDKVLIVAGDTFDTKRTLTTASHKAARRFFKIVEHLYEKVFFVIGNHDVADTKKLAVNLFDMFDLPTWFEVVDEYTEIKVNGKRLGLVPYKLFGSIEFAEVDAYITHESLTVDQVEGIGVPIYNGHIHTRSKYGVINNLGSPYQLDWSEIGEKGGYHILNEDMTADVVEYDRPIYHRVKLEGGKVDGINPIKWLTNNREKIQGTSLEIIVDEETDRTLYDKFQHVLGTIRLRELRMTEDISFSSKPLSENSTSIIDAIDHDLERPGAKKKLKEIAAEVHYAH